MRQWALLTSKACLILMLMLMLVPVSAQAVVIETQEWETWPGGNWSRALGQSGAGATPDCTVTPSQKRKSGSTSIVLQS